MFPVLCQRWWMLLLRGVAFILLGIMAIVWPQITLYSLMIVYGAIALADGLAGIAIGLGGAGQGRIWWPMVLLGLLALAAGVTAIAYPGLTAVVLLWIIAVSAIVRGVLEIVAAIALRKELDDEWVLALSGVLSLLRRSAAGPASGRSAGPGSAHRRLDAGAGNHGRCVFPAVAAPGQKTCRGRTTVGSGFPVRANQNHTA